MSRWQDLVDGTRMRFARWKPGVVAKTTLVATTVAAVATFIGNVDKIKKFAEQLFKPEPVSITLKVNDDNLPRLPDDPDDLFRLMLRFEKKGKGIARDCEVQGWVGPFQADVNVDGRKLIFNIPAGLTEQDFAVTLKWPASGGFEHEAKLTIFCKDVSSQTVAFYNRPLHGTSGAGLQLPAPPKVRTDGSNSLFSPENSVPVGPQGSPFGPVKIPYNPSPGRQKNYD